MSTPKPRGTKSSPRKPVDVVTGPTPTIEHLLEEQAELLPNRMTQVNKDEQPIPTVEDLQASVSLHRWLGMKYRRAVIRWQVFAVISGAYSVVITYLWVTR